MIRELKTAECCEINGANGELSGLISAGVFLGYCLIATPKIQIAIDCKQQNVDRFKPEFKTLGYIFWGSLKFCATAFGLASICGAVISAFER